MAYVDWRMEGMQISNCNCDTGCPCQFNSLPTHGNCRAFVFIQIDKGHFGDVSLDGLRWGGFYEWPGPIHLGNGRAMPIIDERANDRQRAALEAIAHGKETEPGTLITQVFSTTLSSALPTQFKSIDLTIDQEAGTAQVSIKDLIEAYAEPIKNPITGLPHRATVSLPTGFEYSEAEFLAGTAQTKGEIKLSFDRTHAHIAKVNWSTQGLVR